MEGGAARLYTAAVIGVGRAGGGGDITGGHRIGHTHGAMLRRHPRVELAAAADINGENLEAFNTAFGVRKGFADYRVMLREVRPRIVSICTYVGLHREMIDECAAAGVKGIICEKPVADSPVALAAIGRVVRETGLKIVVCHMRRYLPALMRAVQLYSDGALGSRVLAFAAIQDWDLSEMGSHWLDLFRYFHQDEAVRWIMAQARVRGRRGFGHAMEDHIVAAMQFESGGRAVLEAGGTGAEGFNIFLTGSEGSIRIVGEDLLTIDGPEGRRTESFKDHPGSGWEPMWDRLLEGLIRWLDGGSEPMTGWKNMSKSSELNLAAYLSAIRGDRVDLPLEDDLNEWPVEILARRV